MGLAIGVSSFLLILQYVIFETSYEQFHANKANLYRIASTYYEQNTIDKIATSSPGVAPALKAEIPEIADVARLCSTPHFFSSAIFTYNEKKFNEEEVYFADPGVLSMFSYSLIQGNNQALEQPYSVVLSESSAKKYFGNEYAVNKTLILNGETPYTVKAVIKDIPQNTHLKFDVLLSFSSLPKSWKLDENWGWSDFYTYVQLKKDADPTVVQKKITQSVEKHLGADFKKYNFRIAMDLQPIGDIHLKSDIRYEPEPNGSEKIVWFMVIIGAIIILISWINFVNLSTAQAMERVREVGMRKIFGSMKRQLIRQFLFESFIYNFLGLIVALVLFYWSLPLFQSITGSQLSDNLFSDPKLIIALLVLLIPGSILCGIYPAFIISSYRPITVLKGKLKTSDKGIFLKKSLIVFQFTASIVLIISTLVIYNQFRFMTSGDLGIDINKVLVVQGPGVKDSTYLGKWQYFKNEVARLHHIQGITASSVVPGNELTWERGFYRTDQTELNKKGIKMVGVESDFQKVFNITIQGGRFFSDKFSFDKEAVVFNESAIRLLGYKNPAAVVGKEVVWDDNGTILNKKVIGVLKDYHQQGLKDEIRPMAFMLKEHLNAPWAGDYFSMKIEAKDLPATISAVQTIYEKTFPGNPYDYFFLDNYFNKQYQSGRQFQKIIVLFATLAIFVACIGLFGLVSLATNQRRKEIGIRKVLGASISSITTLLSRDFLKLILLSLFIAAPIAWWTMNDWLEGFVYRIEIQWWMFVLAGVLAIIVAFVTISFQAIKAALMNPAKSLRSE